MKDFQAIVDYLKTNTYRSNILDKGSKANFKRKALIFNLKGNDLYKSIYLCIKYINDRKICYLKSTFKHAIYKIFVFPWVLIFYIILIY